MRQQPVCPRCSGTLRAPGLMSSAWLCERHGPVAPLHVPGQSITTESVPWLAKQSRVPLWLPWPLPLGWLPSGMLHAGDDRTGARATVVALSGPAPLGGAGDLLLVAEEPGVGLGARYAGLPGTDAGPDAPYLSESTAPHARVQAAGHPTALWNVDAAADRSVYVGEALGHWLWVVMWPETAGLMLLDHFVVVDLRDSGHDLDLPGGAPSPRLVPEPL
jgi:hypothetical protein